MTFPAQYGCFAYDPPGPLKNVLELRLPRLSEEAEFLRAHRATTPDVPNFLHYYHRRFSSRLMDRFLRQLLTIARERLGLARVLVTCDEDNVGSIRTIEKNGGVLENVVSGLDGTLKRRYWIAIPLSKSTMSLAGSAERW